MDTRIHTNKHTHTKTHTHTHTHNSPFLSAPLSLSIYANTFLLHISQIASPLRGDETRSLLRKSVSLLQLGTTTISVNMKKMSSFLLQQGRKLGAEQLVPLGLEGKLDSFTVVKDWNYLM